MIKKFLYSELDFINAWVSYDCFYVDINKSILEQIDDFKEDMLQIVFYEGQYIIDIGWYPSFDINGNFILYVICNQDWENPIYKNISYTLIELDEALSNAYNLIQIKTDNFTRFSEISDDIKNKEKTQFIGFRSSNDINSN